MVISGMTLPQIEEAALKVGVTVDARRLSGSGTRWRVKVNPGRERLENGDRKYQRISAGFNDARRVNAVCWHGFRDFFRACFELAPEARIKTSMDTWDGRDDFEARYRASGHRNVGSVVFPRCAAEVCRCGEEGMAV